MQKPFITAQKEGGKFRLSCSLTDPIRVYRDGRIEDDIAFKFTGSRVRKRLTLKELDQVFGMAVAESSGWL